MQAMGYRSQTLQTRQGQAHYYQVRGSGKLPPIVVFHGFGSHSAEMYELLQHLRYASREVIAVDLPMHGLSEIPRDGVSLASLDNMFFESLDQVLDQHEPVIFFGNSLGGLAAIRYYLYQPERVRLMVLSSPGGASVDEEAFASVRDIFSRISQKEPQELVSRLYNQPPLYHPLIAKELQLRFARQEFKEFMAYFKTEYTFRPEELQQIAIPTLVIWGQQDRILENHLQFYKAHMPEHVKFLEPPHYSHAPFLEHARELAHQIRSFALLHCHEIGSKPC